MKRTTFRLNLQSEDGTATYVTWEGWTYTHKDHPGRAFVIHHPSGYDEFLRLVVRRGWIVSDVESGCSLRTYNVCMTRGEAAAWADRFLERVSPAFLADRVAAKLLAQATARLQQEAATETLQVAA